MDKTLKAALLSIFRPLVRYLVGRGWTYPVLTELLKSVYVAEAVTHYGGGQDDITDSRVSLLTGIHRKDVKRLRAALREANAMPSLRRDAGLAARVVAGWMSSPRYLNARRRPRVLPLFARGGRLSFEKLVREVRADMRPNVILEELERVGVVELSEDNKVRLVRNAYVSDLPRDKIAYLGDNVGDHIQSALHNLGDISPPFLERAVYYELIAAEDIEHVKPELHRLAEEFLRNVNRRVMPLNADAIRRRERNGRRMRLGVFYYEDNSRVALDDIRRGGAKREHKS